jgi:dihydroneopterin aldolase
MQANPTGKAASSTEFKIMQTEIQLQGLEFFATHGLYKEENRLGNRFRVDVHLLLDVPFDPDDFRIENTIDYAGVYAVVKAEMETECPLLESLGQRMIRRITCQFPDLLRVDVAVSKANPSIGGLCEWVRVNSHWETS